MPRKKAFDESAVLAKARDLFWERGYTATSIGDLEKALGISRSSIYASFGDKRALYDKTLAAYQHENLGRLKITLDETSDLRKTLHELFLSAATIKNTACQTGSRGCYVVNATTEMANACPEALNFVVANRKRFVVTMQDALARAQVQGTLDEQADPTDLANYLFVCYNGLQVVVQTGIEREALIKAVRHGVDALPWKIG